MDTINYDYEKSRKNAFIIANNKLYIKEYHFDCLMAALKDKIGDDKYENRYDELFYMDETELGTLLGGIIAGEIGIVDDIESLICYNETDLDNIKLFFNNQMQYYRCSGWDLYEII